MLYCILVIIKLVIGNEVKVGAIFSVTVLVTDADSFLEASKAL
jgi:hypothetical protein